MADPNQSQQDRMKENARKRIEDDRKAREMALNAQTNMSAEGSTPTPTQEENDMAKLGVYLPEKEPDGSPEQDFLAPQQMQTRHLEAKPGTPGYETRAAQRGQPQPRPRPEPPTS